MGLSITKEQIDLFKLVASSAEPYPIDELDKYMYYDDTDEERDKRCDATLAKKFCLKMALKYN